MKDRKFEIGVMIFIVTFTAVVIGGYLIYDIILSKQSYTLFLKPFKILDCKKWKCEDVSKDIDKYNNKKYNVVIDGEDVGVNSLYFNSANSKYYVFNDENQNLYSNGSLFGYTGKVSISPVKYDIEKISKDDFNNFKDKLNIDFNENYIIDEGKISLDFDDDGKLETLYYFYTGLDVGTLDMYFEYVIFENNSKFYIIIGNSSLSTDVDNVGISSVTNVLDIFDDGKLEFVLSSRYGATGKTCDSIYRLKGKKFVQVNDCKAVENKR